MPIEQAAQTRFLPADKELSEFRGPVCKEWEMWWKKIAAKATLNEKGFLIMNERVIGKKASGQLYGDASIFGGQEFLGQGVVLIKNHGYDGRLRSLVGVTNGLTVGEGYAFTVELTGNEFLVLRAAQETHQALLTDFFYRCTL